jgi:microcystin-dependent protein
VTRKTSQPRDVRFISRFAPIPESSEPEVKAWWEDVQAALLDDHQTIEDAFAKLRQDLESANSSAAITALVERIAALEARPAASATTTNTTVVQNTTATDELTADQKDAIAGTFSSPNNSNRFVTNLDPRLAAAGSIPSGAVIDFGGATAPDGWLLCDGSPVSRETYARLYDIIGTTYGIGDGATTFNVPDSRGRSSMGAGTGAGLTARLLGDKTGEETHTLTGAESGLPAHKHTVPWRDNTSGSGSDNDTGTMTAGVLGTVDTSTTVAANASQGHNTIHPVIVFSKIIKF